MSVKVGVATLWLLVALAVAPCSLSSAASQGEAGSPPLESAAIPSVTRLTPIAIGAFKSAGEHLVRPRPEIVQRILRNRGIITPGMPPQAARSATAAYYQEFARRSSQWVSPAVQVRALGLQEAAASAPVSPIVDVPASGGTLSTKASRAVQPVTANILVLAVEFGGNDTFTYYGREGTSCKYLTVTTTGPHKGQITHPGPRDNNTVWYDPAQTSDAAFYEKLIFGYQGVGRIRLDLEDPRDHLPGINLAGYTVQDYYDHMAGIGNVQLQGSVQGWVTVPHGEGYYGADGCSKHDGAGPGSRADLVVDALAKFMDEHPEYYSDNSSDAFWRQFDANGDGVVDSLWIIHAGMGQEAGGGAQGDFAIWSHSSDLRNTSEWPSGYPVYEGWNGSKIVIGPYTMVPENVDLGVLVEEFGHNFFGLPDLYTNDIENSIGFWSIMSAGTWAGWLGGATPVGMPLWFRMIAQCGDSPCNWHLPMRTMPYNASARKVVIGRLESTPNGLYKGIRINLPDTVTSGTLNRAATGRGAYTGSGLDNLDITLDRPLAVPADAKRLTLKSYWDIEEDRDYGYMMLQDGSEWFYLQDLGGVMRDTNPYGNNLGWGLTGSGTRRLSFDLTPYRSKTVTLRFRYKTDGATTGAGWWVDDPAIDGRHISRFESATPPATFPGSWRNSTPGWLVVPTTATSYPNYYLVEWRTNTKYDRMLKTAYAKNLDEENEWQVERVPYNIPGAVLYYCNTLYGNSYQLSGNLTASPSIGPKYPLLVIDMNYQPMRLDDNLTILDPRIASYDAALTLQASKPFTISQIITDTGILEGPWTFSAKPPVTRFDDGLGYYAGLFSGSPCEEKYCYTNQGGSAVIPALGKYTTRITHYDGTPYTELYGKKYKGSYLGSGNPGDEGLQWGVRIELLNKTANGKSATLLINSSPSN